MVFIIVADTDLRRCSNCDRLEKELQGVKAQLAAKDTRVHTLEERVSELEGYVFGRHHKPQGPAKKPGAKSGHPGWFRPCSDSPGTNPREPILGTNPPDLSSPISR